VHIIIKIDAPQHGNERLIACQSDLVSSTGRRWPPVLAASLQPLRVAFDCLMRKQALSLQSDPNKH